MAYRIPSAETVRDALRRVLVRSRGAPSLSRLTKLVAEELQQKDAQYRIGPERLRRIAARTNLLETTIHTRKAGNAAFAERCPVCGAPLRTVRNRTLAGGSVDLEARCTSCPYWTGRDRRVPVRYTFHIREWRFGDRKRPR